VVRRCLREIRFLKLRRSLQGSLRAESGNQRTFEPVVPAENRWAVGTRCRYKRVREDLELVMNGTLVGLAFCAFLTFAAPAARGIESAQVTEADPLQPLAFILGRWEGMSEGQPGAATVQREYTRILNSIHWAAVLHD
jgi:hypothetical protein